MSEHWESFRVKGDELLAQVRRLLHEGNVRRIVLKQGERTVVEFPLTVGVIGVLAAPLLAAVGALAALLTDCTIHVLRDDDAPAAPAGAAAPEPAAARPRKKAGAKKAARRRA